METKMKTQAQVASAVIPQIVKQNGVNLTGNRDQSMKILADHDMRALTYQEALVWLTQNPEIKQQLKGKFFFYLEGVGIDKNGLYTVDGKGELKSGSGKLEETVRVWPGKNPLSLDVVSDGDARIVGGRFVLDGVSSPDGVAPVVVGVKLAQAEPSRAAAQNDAFASLFRVGEKQKKVVINYPNGTTTEVNAPEGTTVHVE